MRLVLVACAVVSLAGCRVRGEFACETSEQCRAASGPGTCTSAGFCAFGDADCSTGLRYADSAGEMAGRCVTESVDAGVIDAAPFDPSTCPAVFDRTLDAAPNARFYLLTDTGTYGQLAERCSNLLPGASHPANVPTEAVATDIGALATGPGAIFVGVLQDPAATSPEQGWINIDGTTFDIELWRQGQPDDLNDSETDHRQQAGAIVQGTSSVSDETHVMPGVLLCACDGVPISAQGRAFLVGNTWAD